jgi:hypothetical protein
MTNWPSAQQPSAGLGGSFRTRLDVVPAFTDALRDKAYRLRHAVSSQDLGFEPLQPDGR